MAVSSDLKKDFLTDFQNKIVQSRKLLQIGNHRWGDKLLTDLYFDIEKSDWLDAQKKHQLIMIIANSWWMYINSLSMRQEDRSLSVDFIKYIDAYKRFFSFLSRLEDFYLFNRFANNLLEMFMGMENISLQ